MRIFSIILLLSIIGVVANCLDPQKISKLRDSSPLILTDLTPDEAKTKSSVSLPGMSAIKSYAGFLRVNTSSDGCLFMWFFPALSNSSSAPLLLWLQGGPGAPSVYAIFVENGPIVIDVNGNPSDREINWVQKYNVRDLIIIHGSLSLLELGFSSKGDCIIIIPSSFMKNNLQKIWSNKR